MSRIGKRIIHCCAVTANSLPEIELNKLFDVLLESTSLVSDAWMGRFGDRNDFIRALLCQLIWRKTTILRCANTYDGLVLRYI